jgi:hypothetical protein
LEISFSRKESGALQLEETAVMYVRFEVFTAVTMKNAVFWDVAAGV